VYVSKGFSGGVHVINKETLPFRYIFVPSQVMIECLQNHTPDVLIVDEIGRKQEVQATRDVGNRGAVVCERATNYIATC
jgi:hypothetical protein